MYFQKIANKLSKSGNLACKVQNILQFNAALYLLSYEAISIACMGG